MQLTIKQATAAEHILAMSCNWQSENKNEKKEVGGCMQDYYSRPNVEVELGNSVVLIREMA